MNKRLAVMLIVGASCTANAATVESLISPNRVVVDDNGARSIVALSGTPVYDCGLSAFSTWSARLQGQRISFGPNHKLALHIDGAQVTLERTLVRSGWLRPSVLDDDAQTAMTERRGGWACAPAEVPFEAMHTSVDPKILAGIALNESAYNGRAWPWTLNVAGRGFYFRSREDAYRAIQILLADGRCDFDVGIMQINWCYHAKRFATSWDALEPSKNIHAAEDILEENYRKTGSAAKAVAYYHSANPLHGREYLARFERHLSQIDRGL